MKKKFWSWILTIFAYSLPIIVGLVVTHNINVLWGYVPMVFQFLLFWYGSEVYCNSQAGEKAVFSAVMAIVAGILIVSILLIFPDPNVLWLMLGQFALAWIVHAMVPA